MKFNKRLIALRHAKGLSQKQLGEALKISPESINSWEVGLSVPNFDQLTKLANFFGMPLDILVKGIDSIHSESPIIHMDEVNRHSPGNNDRQRVITQLEILCGSVASVTILGTIIYLIATKF